jgi:long-chain acyl-CoA synthetase
MFMCGGRIGFFGGDIKQLVKDIQALRPTIFVSVPRLLNRIYDKVTAGTAQASRLKKALYNKAMKSKTKDLRKGLVRQDSVWDKLVLKRVRDLLGGRVRFIFTGSAPIAIHVLDFLRAGFGCQVFEGYGQTECTSGCSTTLPHDMSSGHVGPPLVSALIKLADVPDMNYFASQGEGEICIKGPSVFLGYYKDEEKTREALDEEGWLHSGDIGRWNENGTLTITDRKKHIFKLSQGEYVAPEKVENVYCRSPLVAQAYVHGNSLQDSCVAIIVPDEEELALWAKRNNVPGEFDDLCSNAAVEEALRKDMERCARDGGLKSFEQAKVIRLQAEPFTVENGLLTPTYKLRRPTVRHMFTESVNEMYGSITISQVQAVRSMEPPQ